MFNGVGRGFQVAAPRSLSPALQTRLQEVANLHGGKVNGLLGCWVDETGEISTFCTEIETWSNMIKRYRKRASLVSVVFSSQQFGRFSSEPVPGAYSRPPVRPMDASCLPQGATWLRFHRNGRCQLLCHPGAPIPTSLVPRAHKLLMNGCRCRDHKTLSKKTKLGSFAH